MRGVGPGRLPASAQASRASVFILAGQAVASLAVDHFGRVGFDENPSRPGGCSGSHFVAAGVAAVHFL